MELAVVVALSIGSSKTTSPSFPVTLIEPLPLLSFLCIACGQLLRRESLLAFRTTDDLGNRLEIQLYRGAAGRAGNYVPIDDFCGLCRTKQHGTVPELDRCVHVQARLLPAADRFMSISHCFPPSERQAKIMSP